MTLTAFREPMGGSYTTLPAEHADEGDGPRRVRFSHVSRQQQRPRTEIEAGAVDDRQQVDPSEDFVSTSFTEIDPPSRKPMFRAVSPRPRSHTASHPYRVAVRVHLVQQLSDDLSAMAREARSTGVAPAVGSFLDAVHKMADVMPEDSLTDISFSLANALIVGNRWTEYSSDQFEGARRILSDLGNRKQVTERAADKAIVDLEEIGFATTGFSFGVESDE